MKSVSFNEKNDHLPNSRKNSMYHGKKLHGLRSTKGLLRMDFFILQVRTNSFASNATPIRLFALFTTKRTQKEDNEDTLHDWTMCWLIIDMVSGLFSCIASACGYNNLPKPPSCGYSPGNRGHVRNGESVERQPATPTKQSYQTQCRTWVN